MKFGECKLNVKGEIVDVKFCFKSVALQSKASPELMDNKILQGLSPVEVLEQLISACYYGYLAACFYSRIEPKFDSVDFWEEYEKDETQFKGAFECFIKATGVNDKIPKGKPSNEKKKTNLRT